MDIEFVVVLTEHRFLGTIFHPLLIEKGERYHTTLHLLKSRDFNDFDYPFSAFEKEIVNLTEKYSDEKLMRKFSRASNVSELYNTLRPEVFEKNIQPYIEEKMMLVANILMLSPVRLFKKDSKYANIYEEDLIDVPPFFGRPEFHFERTLTETRYHLKIFLNDRELKINDRNSHVITNKPLLLLHGNELIVFEKLTAKRLSPFFTKDFVVVPNTIEDKYYGGFVLKTVRDYDVKAKGFVIENVVVEKKAILSLEKSLQYDPVFVLYFQYGNERFLHTAKRKLSVSVKKDNSTFIFRKTVRDKEWETATLKQILELGLVESNGTFSIRGMSVLEQSNAMFHIVNWLNDNKPKFLEYKIEVEQNKLEKAYFTGEQKLVFESKLKGDWFDIYAVVHFGEFEVPFIKLKRFILNDIREFELPNGEIAILPEEWFARFKGMLPFTQGRGKNLMLGKHHFTLLKEGVASLNKSTRQKLEALEKMQVKPVSLPEKLNATLRSYQEEGFQWMYHLKENDFGACLADDMGLGKTLQTLTLLLKLKREKREVTIVDPFGESNQLNLFGAQTEEITVQPASLIVVPTSLVHNWRNEIEKFTPSLKTYIHMGASRNKSVDMNQIACFYDVIITTYGTLRNDRKMLSATKFFYIILDESQSIKNPTSKTYKAVMDLKSEHRLVITGTPIENSLSDLWSQMNFLNEGMLGSLPFFKKVFLTPIEKMENIGQQEKLQAMIRPFILRRKKSEVAKDLPPLMEQVLFCEMTQEQSKLYDHEKSVVRNAILQNIDKQGVENSAMIILAGLTKLRQLANHPAMIGLETEDGSGKFEEIFDMLENVIAENHKVLVFSTFVKHLELLKKRIEEKKWKYTLLTGSTTKRENVIRQFQEDPENRIFLISLKAGGVGLNLTEADYVFIIDPWWNPAAENQAINRAHRIGQSKNVFVYRFIAENTIEEKIQLLKERKNALADKFINSNNPLEKITKEEIVALFE